MFHKQPHEKGTSHLLISTQSSYQAKRMPEHQHTPSKPEQARPQGTGKKILWCCRVLSGNLVSSEFMCHSIHHGTGRDGF